MKKNKSKGFTLIELMVVISIIGLLSSIVLASLQSAREKAVLAKAVGEMKGLQTALELYKSKFGVYPGSVNTNYGDDDKCNHLCHQGFDNLIQTELVNNKFISKVPHAPNYPDNCNSDCWDNGYFIGYSTDISGPIPTMYPACNGQKINNYYIYMWSNSKKINLPILQYVIGSDVYNYATYELDTNPPYFYCISM